MTTAALLSDTMQMLRDTRRHQVSFDLSGVSFCDCAGLRTLLAAAELGAAGGRLTLIKTSPSVRRLLHLSGSGHLLAPVR